MSTGSVSSSVGLISGINYEDIISKMTALDQRPISIIKQKQIALQTQSDALGTISSVLTTLRDQLNNMANPSQMVYRTASSSASSAISVAADNTAALGSYSVDVTQLASAGRATFNGVSDLNALIAAGAGTFAYTLGGATHTYNLTATTTLANLRDMINQDSSSGVSASIVNTGSATNPYRLVLSASNTGAANTINITNNDSNLTVSSNTAGQDANLTINGLAITRSTNTITDVLSGLTLTLKDKTTSTATLNVSSQTGALSASILQFQDSWNKAVQQINKMTAYDTKSKTGAPLLADPTLRMIRSDLGKIVSSAVTGLSGQYNSLASIGFSLNPTDGTLNVDQSKLTAALNSSYSAVQAVFSRMGTAADSSVQFVSSTSKTANGSYSLNITQAASQAQFLSTQDLSVTPLAANEKLTFSVAGKSFNVDLAAGATLAQAISTLNAAFQTQSAGLEASNVGGNLRIRTSAYGAGQAFTITSDQANAAGQTGVGTTPVNATGTDVAATLNGVALFGAGQSLTGTIGSKFEGLQLTATGSAPLSTTLNLTGGVSNSMLSVLNQYLDSSTGIIKMKQDGLSKSITGMNTQIDNIQKYIDDSATRMRKQFIAMESQLAKYQTMGSYISKINALTSSSSSSSSA